MIEAELKAIVRRERLELLLDMFQDDLRIAVEHVAHLRGALDEKVGQRNEPLPRFRPPRHSRSSE